MRLQLRIAIVHQCSITDSPLPLIHPLPETESKPLPLLRRQSYAAEPPSFASFRAGCSPATCIYLATLLLWCGAFGTSLAFWAPAIIHPAGKEKSTWVVKHADTLVLLVVGVVATAIACRRRGARRGVALCSCVVAVFLAAHAIIQLLECSHYAGGANVTVAYGDNVAAALGAATAAATDSHTATVVASAATVVASAATVAASAASANATVTAIGTSRPAVASVPSLARMLGVADFLGMGVSSADSPVDCSTVQGLWPSIVFGIVALAAVLQVGVACLSSSWGHRARLATRAERLSRMLTRTRSLTRFSQSLTGRVSASDTSR